MPWVSFTADPNPIVSRLLAWTMQAHAEEYVLVMALSQACQWLKLLARYEPTLLSAVRAFVASVPAAGEVRDMWEHEIDYVTGRGKHPDRWLWPLNPEVSMEATGATNGRDEDGRWVHQIGGRIDVGDVVAAAVNMLTALDAAFERLPPPAEPDATDRT